MTDTPFGPRWPTAHVAELSDVVETNGPSFAAQARAGTIPSYWAAIADEINRRLGTAYSHRAVAARLSRSDDVQRLDGAPLSTDDVDLLTHLARAVHQESGLPGAADSVESLRFVHWEVVVQRFRRETGRHLNWRTASEVVKTKLRRMAPKGATVGTPVRYYQSRPEAPRRRCEHCGGNMITERDGNYAALTHLYCAMCGRGEYHQRDPMPTTTELMAIREDRPRRGRPPKLGGLLGGAS